MSNPTVSAPAPVDAPAPEKAARAKAPAERRTRRARLRISRIDPWSVMKTSFLFSIAFGIMSWIAVYVVWSCLLYTSRCV